MRRAVETTDMVDSPPQRQEDEILLVPERTASQLSIERMFDELANEENENNGAIAALAGALTPPSLGQGTGDEDEILSDKSLDDFRPPAMFRVKRHRATLNKMVDWHLEVNEKWLILGDSNLSRCPASTHQHFQMESYPGANFRHAESFIRRARVRPGLVVERVVLSFGINNRGNKPRETTIKNLQATTRAVKNKFPYAQFWIVLINFSPELDQVEQQNLVTLNGYIHKNMPFVPLLPDRLFRTESDHVHWTAETARYMMEHWVEHLNSQ